MASALSHGVSATANPPSYCQPPATRHNYRCLPATACPSHAEPASTAQLPPPLRSAGQARGGSSAHAASAPVAAAHADPTAAVAAAPPPRLGWGPGLQPRLLPPPPLDLDVSFGQGQGGLLGTLLPPDLACWEGYGNVLAAVAAAMEAVAQRLPAPTLRQVG